MMWLGRALAALVFLLLFGQYLAGQSDIFVSIVTFGFLRPVTVAWRAHAGVQPLGERLQPRRRARRRRLWRGFPPLAQRTRPAAPRFCASRAVRQRGARCAGADLLIGTSLDKSCPALP